MTAPGTIKPKQIGKAIVTVVVFLLMLFVAITLIMKFTSGVEDEPKGSGKKITSFETELILQAQHIYEQKKQQGWDFSTGPCLSDNLASLYVVDIAHDPRQAIDDLPENQCPAFINGLIKNFIELDPEGQLIRIQ
jgi:hypothetical protein